MWPQFSNSQDLLWRIWKLWPHWFDLAYLKGLALLKILTCGPLTSEQNWWADNDFKFVGFVIFAHLWDVFFNQNSDLVSLSTPYSHNSGPILPGIKSTGAQEPGASRSVFGSWLRPFSWEELRSQNGCTFFLGQRKYKFSKTDKNVKSFLRIFEWSISVS